MPFPLFCLAIISGPNAKDSVEKSDILVNDDALRWKEPRDRSYDFPYSY